MLMKDMNDFAAMNEVYAEAFGDHRPARAAFQVRPRVSGWRQCGQGTHAECARLPSCPATCAWRLSALLTSKRPVRRLAWAGNVPL